MTLTNRLQKKTYRLARAAPHSLHNKMSRVLWNVVWLLLFRPTPRPFHAWRCLLLRLFGAKIGTPAYVYPSARIWAPWNLELGDRATIGEQVDCYCVGRIEVGSFSTVSQYSFLCTASHDYLDPSILEDPCMPLLAAPIQIGERVWIAADVFVGPGVKIDDGAVVHARSAVFSDVPRWTIVAGNPASIRGPRVLRGGIIDQEKGR